jgi:hypothetical protein
MKARTPRREGGALGGRMVLERGDQESGERSLKPGRSSAANFRTKASSAPMITTGMVNARSVIMVFSIGRKVPLAYT